MKWSVLILLVCSSVTIQAQSRFTVHGEAHLVDSLKLGWGGGFKYSYTIGNNFTVGAGVSAIKFRNANRPYVPVFAHTAFHPFKLGKVTPMVFAEGGKTIYSEEKSVFNGTFHSQSVYRGGHFLFGGIGARFQTGGIESTLSVGRSSFGTRTSYSWSNGSAGGEDIRKITCNGWGARISFGF